MTDSTAWSSGAHGSTVLHQCTHAPRRRSLRKSRRRRCVCGRSMAAGGTHSLVCGVVWHTVVARHNALTEVRLGVAAHGGIAATRRLHVQQLQSSTAAPCKGCPSRPHPPRAHAGAREPCSPQHPPLRPRHGRAFHHPWHPGSSPTCSFCRSCAIHPWGRGRCRALHSCRGRRGLSGSCSHCGQCRCCAQRGSGHRNARRSPSHTHRCGNCRRPLWRRHRHDTAPATLPARPPAR